MNINSEKNYYQQYLRQVKAYYHYEYILWAEDLLNSKIVIYSGKLKELEGVNSKALECVGLTMIYNRCTPPVKIVSANANVEEEIVYISLHTFQVSWPTWRKSINLAIQRAKAEGRECHLSCADDLIVLDYLKAEGKTVALKAGGIEFFDNQTKKNSEKFIDDGGKKQSLLSNTNMLFFYDSQNLILHDKDCKCIREILPERFCASDIIPGNSRICPTCKKRLLLRVACEPYVSHISKCGAFLIKMNLSDYYLEKFVVEKKLKFKMVSDTEMEVKGKEDTWRISGKSKADLQLYHNNYARSDDGGRIFLSGFHKQGGKGRKISTMLFYISDYTWEGHLRNEKKKKRKQWFSNLWTAIKRFFSVH